MSDNRDGEDGYDWLYSSGGARPDHRPPPKSPPRPAEQPRAAGADAPRDGDAGPDPDATQAMPIAGDHDEHADDPHGADEADDAEHTQVLDRSDDAADADDADDAADADDADDASNSGAPSPSFGGVYAAPAARRGDRPTPSATPPPSTPPSARPPAEPAKPGGGRRKHRNWWLRGALILFGAWLIFLTAVPIWSWQHISKVDAEPGGTRPDDTPGTTYLLVGSDSREDLTKEQRQALGTGDVGGQRTDTIILLHVPAGDGPRLLLSIPRDSYVNIPGYGMNKINAAYAFGGPKLLVETVEHATDLRIDDYIEVGFTGFVDIVDAVGGITVCPETAINDPKAGGLKMKKGCQEVDGHTALEYSRSRAFALGDITRAEHQREVITAVGKKAASWQTIVFPWRYWKVNHAAAESLRVGDNVGPVDLTRFAWAMAHTGGSDSKRCVVPYTNLGAQTSSGSVVTWDKKAAKAIFQAVSEDDTASIDCSPNGQ